MVCGWGVRMGPTETGGYRIDKEIGTLAGGANAPIAIRTYRSFFKKWAHFRELQNVRYLIEPRESYLVEPFENQKGAGTDVLRVATPQYAPIQHIGATIATYAPFPTYANSALG